MSVTKNQLEQELIHAHGIPHNAAREIIEHLWPTYVEPVIHHKSIHRTMVEHFRAIKQKSKQ